MSDGTATASWQAEPVIDWLFHKGRRLPGSAAMLDALCRRVVADGLPLARVAVFVTTIHPLYFGSRLGWSPDRGIEVEYASHAVRQSSEVTGSPVMAVMGDGRQIRRRLDGPDPVLDFPVLRDLLAEGFTDYLATPLVFGSGKVNVLTLATRRPGGFSDHDLAELEKLLHIFTMLLENDVNQAVARTVLDTYVGPTSGRRVLQGQVARGDGELINAVIWCSDLRGSTRLSEELPAADYLDLLNDYFEATAGALMEAGGEVLKFIGDCTLGVFAVDAEGGMPAREGCARAVAAARQARMRAGAANAARQADGRRGFDFGIGLHLGQVMYGNIGVPARLDFTVTGAATNHAVRVEGLCKRYGRPVLATGDVARHQPRDWTPVDRTVLAGSSRPVQIFALAG